MNNINISSLKERAEVSFKLNHDNETAWTELKDYYLTNHNVEIPEYGVKQLFFNMLKTLRRH